MPSVVAAFTGDTPITPRKSTWTFYDGDWHHGDIRILGASSHATWLGSLVFDGARAFEGVVPDLDRHCERLNTSAHTFALAPTLTTEAVISLSREGLKKFAADAAVYIRPMYWAEHCDRGVVPPLASSTAFALCLEELPMTAPAGFSITTTRFRRPTLDDMPVNAKAACLYPNNARMMREATAKGYDNALVCDALGNVAELATSNIFMVRGGEVFSPIPNGTFLDGITRQRVIRLLRHAGISVHEKTLTMEEFHQAEEIFSSGNISKVMPVRKFDDLELPYGPIARRARDLYWQWSHD